MLIFDAHIDTLSLLLTSSRISRPRQTLAGAEGHVNLEYLRQGNIGAQFWAAFVHPRSYNGLALHDTLEKIDFFWTMLDDYPDYLTFAGSAQDIRAAQATGRLACLLAVEGGEALEGKLAHLRNLYRLGVRLLTLTWNFRNDLGAGQMEGPEGGGLSRFGLEVVEEMNRLGMLIDVSHLNEPGFWDVIEASSSPVIASHSNAKALCDHPRNLTDEQIRAIADGGGVIGVNFCTAFLTSSGAATLDDVLNHIDYLVKVGGIETVGLGSDFDGITETPIGLENCSRTLILADGLNGRGYSVDAIEKIMGGNLLRLCANVLG
ncbi:MAG: dipeptidase [Bacillota bacterium]|nr:dipeptidase [Bacillota bacterium]